MLTSCRHELGQGKRSLKQKHLLFYSLFCLWSSFFFSLVIATIAIFSYGDVSGGGLHCFSVKKDIQNKKMNLILATISLSNDTQKQCRTERLSKILRKNG